MEDACSAGDGVTDVVAPVAVVDRGEEVLGGVGVREEEGEESGGLGGFIGGALCGETGDAVGDDIVGIAGIEHAEAVIREAEGGVEEVERAVGGGAVALFTGGIEEVPEAVDGDGEIAEIGAVVLPVPAFVGLEGESAIALGAVGVVGNEIGRDGADPREGGESGNLLVGGFVFETGGKLTSRDGEAGADGAGLDDALGGEFGDGEGAKGNGRVALFPRVVLLESAMEAGTFVPEQAGTAGDATGEGFGEEVGGAESAGFPDGIATLLEDDGGEVADAVVPPIAIEASVGGIVGIAAGLRENARELVLQDGLKGGLDVGKIGIHGAYFVMRTS